MANVSNPLRPDWVKTSQEELRKTYRELSSTHDLASFWGITPSQLTYYAFHVDKRVVYRTYKIPRRYGQERQIDAPVPALKYIQRLIHESLSRVYGPHPGVHGFRIERSILTNAQQHLDSRFVLNVDLADFFQSITRQRIYGRLVAAPYSLDKKVANMIASLATNAYARLPQGSPCSPILANIVAAQLDTDLANLCGALGCWYSRYADDISISTSRMEMPPAIARYPSARGTGQVVIGDSLVTAIEKQGFRINERKSRLQSKWTRQMCTGLVVNGKDVNVPRSYVRQLRSLIDHWRKKGWQDAVQVLHAGENRPLLDSREALTNHVMGRIAYLRMVRGQDDKIARSLRQVVAGLPQDH